MRLLARPVGPGLLEELGEQQREPRRDLQPDRQVDPRDRAGRGQRPAVPRGRTFSRNAPPAAIAPSPINAYPPAPSASAASIQGFGTTRR